MRLSEQFGGCTDRVRSVDDLIRLAEPGTAAHHRLLRRFSAHYKSNPHLLDRLVSLVFSRLLESDAAGFRAVWESLRWGSATEMVDTLCPLYARAAVFCYPELNGRLQFRPAAADRIFSFGIASRKLRGDAYPRLQWANGAELETPLERKPPQVVKPAQGELFLEVVA